VNLQVIFWSKFIVFGGSPVLLPISLAILAWLSAGRAWRMACWWAVLFFAGLAMVAATKIAFLGWGMGIDPLDFQGFSGHAMRTTAVVPVVLYLMLRHAPRRVRLSGAALGILVGAMMGIAVSVHDTHSASEAIAGCVLGAAVSMGFIRISQPLRQPALHPAAMLIVALSLGAALYAALKRNTDPTYAWLANAAYNLSGNETPFVRQLPPRQDTGSVLLPRQREKLSPEPEVGAHLALHCRRDRFLSRRADAAAFHAHVAAPDHDADRQRLHMLHE
jgi:hypothetical protein